jgi:6-pyruvoyltetrahydropterin/6-carboxytetrahydropterin synthase
MSTACFALGFPTMHEYICKKIYADIPFAHRQHGHKGHCQLIHGHNWTFEILFAALELNDIGFVIDLGELNWIKELIENDFDHACLLCADDPLLPTIKRLNEEAGCRLFKLLILPSVSVEGIAEYLYSKINHRILDITENRVSVKTVIVSENSKNAAIFNP